MGGTVLPVGRLGLATALGGATALFLVGVWLLATGGSGPLALAALAAPVLVVIVPLFYLAREGDTPTPPSASSRTESSSRTSSYGRT